MREGQEVWGEKTSPTPAVEQEHDPAHSRTGRHPIARHGHRNCEPTAARLSQQSSVGTAPAWPAPGIAPSCSRSGCVRRANREQPASLRPAEERWNWCLPDRSPAASRLRRRQSLSSATHHCSSRVRGSSHIRRAAGFMSGGQSSLRALRWRRRRALCAAASSCQLAPAALAAMPCTGGPARARARAVAAHEGSAAA